MCGLATPGGIMFCRSGRTLGASKVITGCDGNSLPSRSHGSVGRVTSPGKGAWNSGLSVALSALGELGQLNESAFVLTPGLRGFRAVPVDCSVWLPNRLMWCRR